MDGKNVLEFVAIKRKDTGSWAIPGVSHAVPCPGVKDLGLKLYHLYTSMVDTQFAHRQFSTCSLSMVCSVMPFGDLVVNNSMNCSYWY